MHRQGYDLQLTRYDERGGVRPMPKNITVVKDRADLCYLAVLLLPRHAP